MRFRPKIPMTAVIALVCGCATSGSVEMPGRSSAQRVSEARNSPKTRANRTVWPHFAAGQEWPVVAQFESQSHQGRRSQVAVRTPSELKAEYLSLTHGQQIRDGAKILLSLSAPGAEAVHTYYTAEKLPSGWRYRVLGETGEVEPTNTSLCQRCHAEGRVEGLFGVPTAAKPE